MNAEENDRLTQVGPGTLCGNWFRRYWLPVGIAAELPDVPKLIRILGEDLVLFRDGRGRPGLLGKHCSHRGTSLEYGQLDEEGIRCCYHGWLYDVEGRVLDTPAEPPDSNFKRTVRHLAYPCQELGGWIFAYLGPPEKMPPLPRYDFLVRDDGTRDLWSAMQPYNWLHHAENIADPVHTAILHRIPSQHEFGAYQSEIPAIEFERTADGMMDIQIRSTWKRRNRFILPALVVLPGDLSPSRERPGLPGGEVRKQEVEVAIQAFWIVPVDDTHHVIQRMTFIPFDKDGKPRFFTAGRPKPMSYEQSQRTPTDYEAQGGQGPIARRDQWHLASSDRGVIMMQQILREAIDAVERGDDPPGILRDPEQARFVNTRDSVFIKIEPQPLEPWRGERGTNLWSKRLTASTTS